MFHFLQIFGQQCVLREARIPRTNSMLNNGIFGMQKYETTFKQNLKIKLFLTRKNITMSAVPVYLSYPLDMEV